MKLKSIAALSFLSALTILSISTSSLCAWERKAMNTCKKEEQSCKKYANECKKNNPDCKKKPETCTRTAEECKEDVVADDTSSFEMTLSAYAKTLFSKFSPEQKKKALDLADGNKMPTDDAVAKIAGVGCSCQK